MTAAPTDLILKLLLGAERKINSAGWDQEPYLATLELLEGRAIGIAEIPVEIQNPPEAFLNYLAGALPTSALKALAGDSFYGVAFVCEAWHTDTATPEELKRLGESGRSLADMPGAKEARIISAVDIHGRPFMIMRTRGQSPTTPLHGTNAADDFGGSVLESLRKLTLAIYKQRPGADLTDLETFFVSTIDDAIAASEHYRKRRAEQR